MSLRIAVAAPFQQSGTERIEESTFVVALSLERGWFSPDQAKRLVDVATGQGLLAREDEHLVCTFDPDEVTLPDEFEPDDDILVDPSPFERLLARIVESGVEKRTAVAEINDLQRRLGISVEAAAATYAVTNGIDVSEEAAAARESFSDDD